MVVIQGDDARFPTKQHKLRYTMGLLQGNAFAQILPYILETTIDFPNITALSNVLEAAFGDPNHTGTAERILETLKQANRDFATIDFTNITALLNVLEAAFGDPDRTGTAERILETLKQANRDFSTYYAEFSRHVANTQWNDAAKKTALSRGLSNEIKDALGLADQVPEGYGEFASYLQRLDNRIRAPEAERKGRPPLRVPAPRHPLPLFNPRPPALIQAPWTSVPSGQDCLPKSAKDAYNKTCVSTVEDKTMSPGFARRNLATPSAAMKPTSPLVTGAFQPDGLAFTRPCKIFQAKVFQE